MAGSNGYYEHQQFIDLASVKWLAIQAPIVVAVLYDVPLPYTPPWVRFAPLSGALPRHPRKLHWNWTPEGGKSHQT